MLQWKNIKKNKTLSNEGIGNTAACSTDSQKQLSSSPIYTTAEYESSWKCAI